MRLEIFALAGLPEIAAGDDLAKLIASVQDKPQNAGFAPLRDGDIVVVAQKAVSKAEGRTLELAALEPGDEARDLARRTDKDPRFVQAVLDESRMILRAAPGVLIAETKHGLICANAGIDQSNLPGGNMLLLLPQDPDASARTLRAGLRRLTGAEIGVIVTDSFGRAWRVGQQDIAIGCAGLTPLLDLRGRHDRAGRELAASVDAVADALATAANLARSKTSGEPVIVIRGRADLLTDEDGPGAGKLLRDAGEDLFR